MKNYLLINTVHIERSEISLNKDISLRSTSLRLQIKIVIKKLNTDKRLLHSVRNDALG